MSYFEIGILKRLSLRKLSDKIAKKDSFLLLGPRQTGKTTLLKEIFEKHLGPKLNYFFQLPSQRIRIEGDPEILIKEVRAIKKNTPVLVWIDEIQKVPAVFDVLQFLLDEKSIIFMGSGSSARKLRKFGQNWLPGRIHLEYLHPLCCTEVEGLAYQYELSDFLLYGSLPAIVTEKDMNRRHQDLMAYTTLYLEEEIRAEALTKNIPRFSSFLKLAALESGTSPNFSKIASAIGTTPPTVTTYYHILEDTLTTFLLPPFGTKRSQVIKSPKYYFFDTGVRNSAAQVYHSEGILTLQKGILFEHFIINELRVHCPSDVRLSYWRTKQGDEVDVILEQGKKRVALEIKYTEHPQKDDLKGLLAFKKIHDVHQSIIVCNIKNKALHDGLLYLPWQELRNFLIHEFQDR